MSILVALACISPQGISEAEFRKLHQELQQPREAWLSIPWKTSLHEAREEAIREKKPIFLWSEAGNPLGCT